MPAFRPTEERFWEKVEKNPNGCWNWTGAVSKEMRYGMFRVSAERPTVKAHRYSWELHNGPTEKFVLHTCDNPRCVRPDHLFLGGWLENNQDMTKKGRHGRMRFTHEQVRRLRSLRKKYGKRLSHQRIADWFGVCKATISHMLSGRNWKLT